MFFLIVIRDRLHFFCYRTRRIVITSILYAWCADERKFLMNYELIISDSDSLLNIFLFFFISFIYGKVWQSKELHINFTECPFMAAHSLAFFKSHNPCLRLLYVVSMIMLLINVMNKHENYWFIYGQNTQHTLIIKTERYFYLIGLSILLNMSKKKWNEMNGQKEKKYGTKYNIMKVWVAQQRNIKNINLIYAYFYMCVLFSSVMMADKTEQLIVMAYHYDYIEKLCIFQNIPTSFICIYYGRVSAVQNL